MYCNVCKKQRKFKKFKISHIFKETLTLSIVYSECGHGYNKIFKDEEQIEILTILVLINNVKEYQIMYNYS